ncbi:methyltransferase domain-containing protein [Streptomyces sp. TRM66268-LWL]|uniref:Methyltransferase domain-containing protein n=1 Tax=Streptomyces polyasparticus TaxID=2767826 RepID=A0ABR7SZ18_9ACTN|nr:methyltransferase domain-containing protein [Streptomyces polyasparticus]MBC9719608.1 methyltransferase domain-containing protein [Streptomyces polyasparticus]
MPTEDVLPATPVPSQRPAPYPLGSADDEVSRLLEQCAYYRPQARSLIDRLGVQPGWRTADVGCGPLGILDLLAARTGPTGQVLGLDAQPRMLETARQLLKDHEHVRLEQADAYSCHDHTGLDFAHSRLLLANLPRPEQIITSMVRMVRPGGYVAFQEIDWQSWSCVPYSAAWEELRGRLAEAWSGDVHIGQRLPRLLGSAGLTDITVDASTRILEPDDAQFGLLLYFAKIQRQRLLDTGLSHAEQDRLVQAIRRHLAQPGCLVVDSLLFQAWGKVPDSPETAAKQHSAPAKRVADRPLSEPDCDPR